MFNKFAAGRKVYGQGATAPTRGQVDPGGYIRRELSRRNTQQGVSRVGRDGQSDTRSGIAAKAIHGNIGNNIGRPNANGMQQPGQQMSQWQAPTFGQGAGQGSAVTTPGVGMGAAPPTPVQVNNNGVLELPYNSEYANQALDAQQSFDDEMMSLNFEEQNQQAEMARFMRELESGYVDRQRETLSGAAGNGMLYSSQYTTGANNDATQYNNTKNDATNQNTNFMSQLAARRNSAQSGFNQLIQRITQGYADSLSEDAGNLGYGVSAPTGAPARPSQGGFKGGSGWGSLGGRPSSSTIKPPKPPKGTGGTIAQPTPPKKKGKK